jgi:molecular chaperone DnaK (HSP70)
MDIDANGILSVSAKDKTSGAKASTTIAATASRNSPDDVARMVEEAKTHAAEDRVLREKVRRGAGRVCG